MIYRRIEKADYPKVLELCEKNGIRFDGRIPLIGFVAIGDSGEMVGTILAHQAAIIEPFVSENAATAVKLYYMMEGFLSGAGFQNVIAHTRTSNEKLTGELQRVGFELVDKQFSVFKRTT